MSIAVGADATPIVRARPLGTPWVKDGRGAGARWSPAIWRRTEAGQAVSQLLPRHGRGGPFDRKHPVSAGICREFGTTLSQTRGELGTVLRGRFVRRLGTDSTGCRRTRGPNGSARMPLRPLSNAAINKVMALLGQILDDAVERGYLRDNSARRVRRLRHRAQGRSILQPHEVRAMFEAADRLDRRRSGVTDKGVGIRRRRSRRSLRSQAAPDP